MIEEFNPATKTWQILKTETSHKRDAKHQRKWRVRDKKTNRGYEVVPGAMDEVADAFGVADVWALRYHYNETNDGGSYGKGGGGPANDQIHISKFLNNENIDGQDVVLWYRAGARHGGTIHQAMVGPTLRPFGPGWSK